MQVGKSTWIDGPGRVVVDDEILVTKLGLFGPRHQNPEKNSHKDFSKHENQIIIIFMNLIFKNFPIQVYKHNGKKQNPIVINSQNNLLRSYTKLPKNIIWEVMRKLNWIPVCLFESDLVKVSLPNELLPISQSKRRRRKPAGSRNVRVKPAFDEQSTFNVLLG